VAPEVKLEVLDWGGDGPAVVFLAGLGNTAHVFDEFAPALTDRFHVYGITRRGFGLSSVPARGYDLATLATDVRRTLDALRLPSASLIGHSAAGDELTWFAGAYPDRIDRVVYLDAAYDRSDPSLRPQALGDCFNVAPPADTDIASPASFGAWFARTRGVHLPESELHFLFEGHEPTAAAFEEFMQSLRRPDYDRVVAPALAFFAVPTTAADYYSAWATMTATQRAKAQACFDSGKEQIASRASIADFRARVVRGRSIEILHAKHYIFISNREEVLRETRAFLAYAQ
jgi:pimeloyl-ACP methyl ester carboxylesterase